MVELLSNYVKINVNCPCGRLLKTVNANADGGSITNSSMMCPSCKKNVSIQIRGATSSTSYKR